MQTIERHGTFMERPRLDQLRRGGPAFQAYAALWAGYAVLPMIAGGDKFLHLLTDWNRYLAPSVASLIGGRVDAFMRLVGLVEIAAGVLVAVKPRLGAPVVALWLLGIMGNLLIYPGFFDVALRDFGLAVGAFALWRLSVAQGLESRGG